MGTSALRDAVNSATVRDRIRSELGIDIRVITGAEEAAYSFLAVQRGLSLMENKVLVCDIGGGSTELIWGNEGGVKEAVSIDLGSVRLTERFLHGDPVKPDEIAQMNATIDRELTRLPKPDRSTRAMPTLVGIAATFTTLVAMEKELARYSHSEVHGSILTLGAVRRQLRRLQSRKIAERRQIIGLEPQRADVIFAGAALVERIMIHSHAESVIVSDQGVRYGLLHENARSI